jgi:hypothetical protein
MTSFRDGAAIFPQCFLRIKVAFLSAENTVLGAKRRAVARFACEKGLPTFAGSP